MASNIFRQMGTEEGLFRDERVLMADYLPEILPHRERQVKDIAYALKNAGEGRRPENVVITGKSGTGKTATARYVLKQLSEYSQRVAPIYINCWEHSTRHAVLSRIAEALGEILPRRGIAADEIFARISESLRKGKKTAVVVLDEIDRLLAGKAEGDKVLYDLLRAAENYGVSFGVVGITNSEDFMARLDSRIRSSLAPREIVFPRYSPPELKDILRERAKLAFFDGVLSEDALPLCAAHAAKNGGDARLAIALIWKAGKIAEKAGAKKVSESHCRQAFSSAAAEVQGERLAGLNQVEKRILEIAGEKGGVQSGELYELLSTEFKETDRTVRNYLEKLESLGLVSVEDRPKTKEQPGNSRVIRLAEKE